MSALRYTVLRFHPTEPTMHSGLFYDTAKEAAAIAETLADREQDEEAEIRVVDELELLALAGDRRINLPD